VAKGYEPGPVVAAEDVQPQLVSNTKRSGTTLLPLRQTIPLVVVATLTVRTTTHHLRVAARPVLCRVADNAHQSSAPCPDGGHEKLPIVGHEPAQPRPLRLPNRGHRNCPVRLTVLCRRQEAKEGRVEEGMRPREDWPGPISTALFHRLPPSILGFRQIGSGSSWWPV
jgi:hypothetical protein